MCNNVTKRRQSNHKNPNDVHVTHELAETNLECNENVIDCNSIKRILKTLNNYHSIDMLNHTKCENILVKYCEEYKLFLDDYIHILVKHCDN